MLFGGAYLLLAVWSRILGKYTSAVQANSGYGRTVYTHTFMHYELDGLLFAMGNANLILHKAHTTNVSATRQPPQPNSPWLCSLCVVNGFSGTCRGLDVGTNKCNRNYCDCNTSVK